MAMKVRANTKAILNSSYCSPNPYASQTLYYSCVVIGLVSNMCVICYLALLCCTSFNDKIIKNQVSDNQIIIITFHIIKHG